MKVWRYVLAPEASEETDELTENELTDGFTCELEMVAGAELVGGALTSKGLVLYAVVEPDNLATEERAFFVCGNNVELPEGVGAATHRTTIKPFPGSPTLHVFEVVKVAEPA